MKPSSGSMIRHSPQHNSSSKSDANCTGVSSQVGEIGFKFRKLFPGYGYFDGEVVLIRPGAAGGKDRRCVYSDGDKEDLSLQELQALESENSPQRAKQKSNRGKKRKPATKGENKTRKSCKDSRGKVDRKEVACSNKRPKRIRIPPNNENESQVSLSLPSDKQKEASTVPSVSLSEKIFSSCDAIVPIDRAAEATLTTCNELSKGTNPAVEKGIEDYGEEDEKNTDAWLEKVASLLGAGSRPKGMPSCQRKSLTAAHLDECEKLETPTLECSPIFPDGPLSDVNSVCSSLSSLSNDTLQRDSNQSVTKRPVHQLMDRQSTSASLPTPTKELFCLVNILPGKRHGIKVFHVNDKKRTVGEVILEHPHGYIEAVISGSVEKSRVTNFVVAPEQYSVGDLVSLTLTLPPRLLKLPPTRGRTEHYKNVLDSKLSTCGRQTKQLASHHKPAGDISFSRTVQEKDGSTDRYRSSTKGSALQESAKIQSANPRSMCDPTVTLDNLFYWSCERCTMMNSFSKSRCAACQKRKGLSSPLSALLSIASTAVKKASSVEEALSNVPVLHRPAIPEMVLAKLLSSHRLSAEHTPQAPPSLALDSYFYWMCGECTMKNSYKRYKCIVCENRKTELASCSALLEIAKAASAESRTVKEAMNFIPNERKLEIPEVVLSSLITCNALIGKKHEQRRCLRPKAFGCDFCTWHCDPMMQKEISVIKNFDESCHMNDIGDSVSVATTSPASVSLSSSTRRSSEMSSKKLSNKLTVSCITSSMAVFLSNKLGSLLLNQLRWTIHSIEDTTLCQENNPFPLGMRVRRFFPCYGFHDGRVTKVSRRQIFDQEKGIRRPVLVYRVVYNDGDEEDFMHHEINSLRQVYDQYNVTSIAQPSLQLVPGTIYECQKQSVVKVVKNKTPKDAINPHEGGIAHVKICRDGEPWADLELELTQLQLNVTRKIPPKDGLSCKDEKLTSGVALFKPYEHSMVCPCPKPGELSGQYSFSPLLEWPTFTTGTLSKDQKGGFRCHLKPETEDVMMSPGLWLHRNRCKDFLSGGDTSVASSISDGSDAESPCHNVFRSGVSHSHTGWDPGNALDHVSWDPYGTVICELCKHDKDDHQILLCDKCHLGYHMYCVRPVIVNVPTEEWLCPKCITGPDGGSTFCELVKELENKPNSITEFMCLPYDDPGQFVIEHEYELQLFSPSTHVSKRQAIIGTSRSKATAQVGHLSFSRNTNNNDWLLPLPLISQEPYRASLASMVASMKYSGMASYSEELVYSADFGVTEDMNDPALDSVQPMSQRNLDIFKEFKANIRRGAFPPIRVTHDEKVGFSVEALAAIPRHTLITEYIGEVTTVEQSGQTSSDSLMVLLDTGDPKTSLIIDPTRTGNIARFLSGINNRSNFSRRKANVRTRRFVLDGKCRVALFTAKKIEPGDKLHYDYNAGVEGRTAKDWARNGFYDTSNFF